MSQVTNGRDCEFGTKIKEQYICVGDMKDNRFLACSSQMENLAFVKKTD